MYQSELRKSHLICTSIKIHFPSKYQNHVYTLADIAFHFLPHESIFRMLTDFCDANAISCGIANIERLRLFEFEPSLCH